MMLKEFEIIPAIDIINGECVRLYQGQFEKVTIYSKDPVRQATYWETQGGNRIHVVDLEGAKTGVPQNEKAIINIAKNAGVPIQVGGGIRNIDNMKNYLEAGVDKVILGTSAIKDEEFTKMALEKYPNKTIIGIDLKEEKPVVEGWIENTELSLDEFLTTLQEWGANQIIVTDIAKDGAMIGPNFELYKHISDKFNFSIIASGGISALEDVKKLYDIEKVSAAIIGKAFYEGKLDLKEVLRNLR